MPPVTDYTITFGRGEDAEAAAKALRASVRKGIAQGWEPIGGVAVHGGRGEGAPTEVVLLQAMTKT